jgi:hypothetical protein
VISIILKNIIKISKLNLTNIFYHITKKKKINFKNVDGKKIFSKRHNPLIIEKDLLRLNLSLQGIYFYHFHFLPTEFESIFPIKYRKESWKIENPTDWRGYFLASCFIVDCKKIK